MDNNNAEFEQFIDFLTEMLEKYGKEVLAEIDRYITQKHHLTIS